MKTLSYRSIFFILCTLFVSNSAYAAQWADEHGTNCVVEYPGNTFNGNIFYKGWGLDFTERPSLGNWVHCPVQVTGAEQVRYVYVRYWKSSTASRIWRVDFYNGGQFVQAITPPAGVAGWNQFVLDLGAFKSFTNGLGISLGIATPTANTRYVFSDTGAYYQ